MSNDFSENMYDAQRSKAIVEFDQDLACMIVLSAFSQNTLFKNKMYTLANHLHNLRLVEQRFCSDTEKKFMEKANAMMCEVYRDPDGIPN